ncbi:MAG: hypothetical protein PHW94_00415 [Sulfurimonas sp.]|nr:hypothetical protein [Sulfurimonas sp.]
MPANSISIKANNHRIYQCFEHKKKQLLSEVMEENAGADILIITSKNAGKLKEHINNPQIRVMSDEELSEMPQTKCEVLINFDLPQSAQSYFDRVSKATVKAVTIVDIAEQKLLYPIETVIGRVIKQEIRPGYGYVTKKDIANAKLKEELKAMRQKEKEKKELPPKRDFKPKREDGDKPKRDFKPRTENSEKKEYRPKRDDDKRDFRPKKDEGEKRSYKPDEKKNDSWDKKKKSNTFLGHDETGKAKFSGKSGERNHRYDGTKKETFDAPKKPARTINIKERKKEEK